jgi:hypothetical protein
MEDSERYMVELRRPGLGWNELDAVAARAREAAGELTRQGRPVQFLRSVYVPEDGSCFFLYEGGSAADVRSAAERVGMTVDRVVETVHLDRDVAHG